MHRSLAAFIESANETLIAHAKLDSVPEFFTHDYVAHVTGRDMEGGHESVRRFVRTLHRAFSEIKVDVEILVKAKQRVAWQRTLRGIQNGNFMGFPATGRSIVWRDMVTSEFVDGLIAEEWVISDLAEQLLRARKG